MFACFLSDNQLSVGPHRPGKAVALAATVDVQRHSRKDQGDCRPDMTPVLNQTMMGKRPSRTLKRHTPKSCGKALKR